MMKFFAGSLLCLALLSPLGAVAQEAIPQSPIAKAELLVDAPSVKAGVPIQAGVHFTMPAHWHIYWQNPGDSGIPTRLDWTLPEGITASAIQWPLPERLDLQGLINYGYSNEVTLPVTLTPARDGLAGDVKVKASWLICKDICIPESVELSAPLAANPAAAKLIDAALALTPKPFTGSASFDVTAKNVTLTVTRDTPWGSITNARFTPIDDGMAANNPQIGRAHV